MRYPLYCLFVLFFFILSARSQDGENLKQRIKIIEKYIEERGGKVFEITPGVLAPGRERSYTTELKVDRNYRIFLASDENIGNLEMEIKLEHPKVSRKLITDEETETICDVDYKHWKIMTFYRCSALLRIRVSKTCNANCPYAWILTSVGREDYEFAKRGVDGSGNTYELDGDTIYKNGKKHYQKKKKEFVGICVTPKGEVFALTPDGDVYSSNLGTYHSQKRRSVIRMESSWDSKLYMLCDDGAIFAGNSLIYKRDNDKKAVDLRSDNGQVWYITKEGERNFLTTPSGNK